MKRKTKMNGLYKTAFILLIVCILLFIAAIIVAYAFNRPKFSAIFSAGGAFLAFLGIIFAALSKPKEIKKEQSEENIVNDIDNL